MVALGGQYDRFSEAWRPWTFYVGGIDPSQAIGAKSDPGVIISARVQPKYLPEDPDWWSPLPSDWYFMPCYGYRCVKMSGRQWGGKIHQVSRRFNWVKVCMDPGGGGGQIMMELRHTRQLIAGVEEEVSPICTPIDALPDSRAILSMFKRGDGGIESIWPKLPGDDMLVDAMHVTVLDALETGVWALPPCPDKGEMAKLHEGWPEEKIWAHKLLMQGRKQMGSGRVVMNDDGTYALTKRGARQWEWTGKKDVAYAKFYAYVAFRIWLAGGDENLEVKGEDAAMCWT